MPPLSPFPADCRFCSVVSKTNGEDPIGSAWPYHQWLILEMPQPWADGIWVEHPILKQIFQRIKALREEQQIWVRPLAIAPDRDYSQPGYTRILHYQRPTPPFAIFEKQEFLIPDNQILPLSLALLSPEPSLEPWEPYRQTTQHIREILVCTHGNVDVACSRFGYPIYQQLRNEFGKNDVGYKVQGLGFKADDDTIPPPASSHPAPSTLNPSPSHPITPSPHHPPSPPRIWRCSHFGGHNYAPTLVDLPTGQMWGHLEPDILATLMQQEGDVTALKRFYRGWCGLDRLEQMVEREIWMQRGWEWLEYAKRGETIAIAPAEDPYYADWAEVRIHFAAPNGSETGTYAARVEVCGEVMIQWNSGPDEPLEAQKQYQVLDLRQL